MKKPAITRFGRTVARFNPASEMSKRQIFVISTIVFTGFLMFTQLVPQDFRYPMVGLLSIVTYFGCAFNLRDDLKGAEWATLLILPTMFTAAVAVFYFLLPIRWITRLPVAMLYAVGIYALLLTENIYSVAAARTIALLRAAHSVGFLLTLITYYLLVQTALAYRLPAGMNVVLIAAITYPLVLQNLWSVHLSPGVGKRTKDLSIIMTVIAGELALILSLWPVRTTLFALFLTTIIYGLLGMGQQYLADRLYKRTVLEFFGVVLIVFVLLIITASWRGAM